MMTKPATDEMIADICQKIFYSNPEFIFEDEAIALIARIRQQDAEIERLRNMVAARNLKDGDLIDEIEAVNATIGGGFGEHGGSPGEWWYERLDELMKERRKRSALKGGEA